MKPVHKRRLIILGIMLICLIEIPLLHQIDTSGEKKEMRDTGLWVNLPTSQHLTEYVSSILLGGFKPFIADYLWIKAERLREDKQFEELYAVLELISQLQPRMEEVWQYNAWNMAYNISRQQDTAEMRWKWVREGIAYLAKGLRRNPQSYALVSALAFLYYHRVPQEDYLKEQVAKEAGVDCYALAAQWYTRANELVRHKLKTPYGDYNYEVMLIASRFHHAYELLKKKRFDEGMGALDALAHYLTDDFIPTYQIDQARWEQDSKDLQTLKGIAAQEKTLWAYEPARADDKFFHLLDEILNQYRILIQARTILNFDAIDPYVERLLLEYLKETYRLMDQRSFNNAKTKFRHLKELTQTMMPESETHPAYYFFEEQLRRWADLETALATEQAAWDKYAGNDVTTGNKYLTETLRIYKTYLNKYDEIFHLTHERKRIEYLESVLKQHGQ